MFAHGAQTTKYNKPVHHDILQSCQPEGRLEDISRKLRRFLSSLFVLCLEGHRVSAKYLQSSNNERSYLGSRNNQRYQNFVVEWPFSGQSCVWNSPTKSGFFFPTLSLLINQRRESNRRLTRTAIGGPVNLGVVRAKLRQSGLDGNLFLCFSYSRSAPSCGGNERPQLVASRARGPGRSSPVRPA